MGDFINSLSEVEKALLLSIIERGLTLWYAGKVAPEVTKYYMDKQLFNSNNISFITKDCFMLAEQLVKEAKERNLLP